MKTGSEEAPTQGSAVVAALMGGVTTLVLRIEPKVYSPHPAWILFAMCITVPFKSLEQIPVLGKEKQS